jgi:predicted membrane protein
MTEGKKYYGGDRISETVVFWGIDKNMDSKAFKGGDATVVFGGAKLDLRDAQLDKNGAKLVLNTAFGGIEVLLPKDCNVISDGVGILGGWDNKFNQRESKGPKLEITGTAIFGGIEIKE